MFAILLFPILEMKNAMLYAKIDELNACKPSTSSVDHCRYPLLQYEGAAPVRHLLVTRRAAPDPTTWAGLKAPRGEEG
jgi:hypothetical protein